MSENTGDRLVAMLPRLRAFARSLARSNSEADDLVQATCERALGSVGNLDPDTRLDAFLFRILRNLWIDHFRKRRREVLGEPGSALFETGIDGGVDARLDLADARRVIARLPEEQREVLNLVCVQDLSYRETAELLRIPIGTVMSRLARARQALAGALAGDADKSGNAGRKIVR